MSRNRHGSVCRAELRVKRELVTVVPDLSCCCETSTREWIARGLQDLGQSGPAATTTAPLLGAANHLSGFGRTLRMAIDLELEAELITDRRGAERRGPSERRNAFPTAKTQDGEKRTSERRKVERRRLIDPTTCERDYTDDEIEFMKAMDEYKRRSGRMFPTWSEVLEVVRSLGYNR